MAAYDDLNIKRIFIVGIASVVVTAVTALAVQVVYYTMVQQQEAKTLASSSYTRQNQFINAQREELSEYGVSETTGNIVVPVSEVIDLMVGGKAESELTDGNDETDAEQTDEQQADTEETKPETKASPAEKESSDET